ncbi:EF-hand domain-containing protein [Duganella sp. S19_KUP01_CR8]|uniref:EF-hand domain-containing protein n=1 Tax=Duganella sp. S19_KUP01_CR8 TaxID=3025502 RepID=UPI002FCDD071
MIMVNNIGGASLPAAVVAEKTLEPKKNASPVAETNADLSASVAAYLSLPGFNSPVQNDPAPAVSAADKASAVVKAVAESDDDGMKLALKQFDEGLKRLVLRPETQFFQAKFGLDGSAEDQNNLVSPDPLPGVDENGVLGSGKVDMAADSNKDGKISPDELRRYQMPITYRSSERAADSVVNGPSAFSLTEANRAYGVVATAEAA